MTITPVARMLGLAEPAPPEGSFIGVEIPEEIGADMEERKVTKEMIEKGAQIKDIQLKENELVILVRRNDKFIVPKGSVILHEEDILLIVSPNKVEEGESSSLPL